MGLLSILLAITSAFYHPVVVVHMEKDWEGSTRVAPAVLMHWSLQTYVLSSSETAQQIFEGPKILAPAGMHDLSLKTDYVVVCGGYFSACFANALESLNDNGHITSFVIPMKAVFDSGHRSLYDTYVDNYKRNDQEFLAYLHQVLDHHIKGCTISIRDDLVVINQGGRI